MIRKVLIANRGEIAIRVARACRDYGARSVAVYADPDADALHVRAADEAWALEGTRPAETYLAIDKLLAIARKSGADAVHPGYGFLSERAEFAQAVLDAGLVWIGPRPETMAALGDKVAARAIALRVGAPLVAGTDGPVHGAEEAVAFAAAHGLPIAIKAAFGGGGRGLKVAWRMDEVAELYASAVREATAAFGRGECFIEQFLDRPRHIEAQILADRHGHVVVVGTRDCSLQRRNQKLVEEAPAPFLNDAQREAVCRAARDICAAAGYESVGTVEFLLGQGGQISFLEVNTRLQVEHPVTELITGTDLVEWQLRVAAGQPLPKTQAQLAIHGHAIEARLYAEDADRGFLPSTGTLRHLRLPRPDAHVRVDAGVEQGDAITPYYDPMIAKLIVHDVDRDSALRRMRQALAQCRAVGVTTNAGFLHRLVATGSFRQADLDTALIEREHDALDVRHHPASAADWALAAVLAIDDGAAVPADASPWAIADGWRAAGPAARAVTLEHQQQQRTLRVRRQADGWEVHGDGDPLRLRGRVHADGYAVQIDDRQHRGDVVRDGNALHVFADGSQRRFTLHDPVAEADGGSDHGGSLLAPMPGRVIALLVEPGSRVARGTPLLVMEAMKMEHTLQAPADGVVNGYRVRGGDQVGDGAVLVDFEAGAGD